MHLVTFWKDKIYGMAQNEVVFFDLIDENFSLTTSIGTTCIVLMLNDSSFIFKKKSLKADGFYPYIMVVIIMRLFINMMKSTK